MIARISPMLVVVVALAISACSVLDGGDRAELEAAIGKESIEDRTTMAAMMLSAKTKKWISGRPKNEAVITLWCRHHFADGTSTDWAIDSADPGLVKDMVFCLDKGVSYARCLEVLETALAYQAETAWGLAKTNFANGDPLKASEAECRGVTNPSYEPIMVPGADSDMNRVTAGEIVEWLLALPAPPPGFSPQTWGPLLPLICALGASWGCPGDPQNPIITGISQSGATGGDP